MMPRLRTVRLGVAIATFIAAIYSLYVTSLQPSMPARVAMTNPEGWKFYAILFGLTTAIFLVAGAGMLLGRRILYYASAGWSIVLIVLFLSWRVSPPPYVISPIRVSTFAIINLALLVIVAIGSVYLLWKQPKGKA